MFPSMHCRSGAQLAQMDQYGFHCGVQKHESVELRPTRQPDFSQKVAHLNFIADFDRNGPLFQVAVLCFPTLIMGDHNAISTFFTL